MLNLRAARLMAMIVPILVVSPASWAQSAPTIASISPTVATPLGGTVITITGTNFVLDMTASFGVNSATKVVYVNKTTLRATTPPSTNDAEGPVNVSVTTPSNQTATLPNGLLYQLPAPTVTSISPTVATPIGGTVITITGTHFVTGAKVAFGANSATAVTVVSMTQLKATTPASTGDAEGPVNVTVTNPDIQAATLSNGFTYQYPAPTVTSLAPTVATPVGGTVITITGTHFVTGAKVAFGANSATAVIFVSATQLKATTPASTGDAEGPVNVTVTNPDTQAATLSNGFTYQYPAPTVTSLSPTAGTPVGGTLITITGTHFVTGAKVAFGANSATAVTFVSMTQLKATTPASPGDAEGLVNVTVTNPDTQAATLSNGFTYQYPAPTVTSLAPTVATPVGGTVITITGTHFVTGAKVAFGANSATAVTFVSATQLKATTPASTGDAEGPVNVTVTNPDTQAATLSNGFTYQYPAPTITKISPAVSSTSGGTVITITGTNFVSGATVAFGPNAATNVTFVSKTSLKATTPASTLPSPGGPEGTVSVFVTNPDAQIATLSEGLTYDLPPSITSISPAVGLPAGGYQVTLKGQYFRCGSLCPGGPVVTFGSTPATSVVFNNNTSLTVTVPAGAAGVANVSETNTDGLSTTLKSGFAYGGVQVTQVSPAIGPLTGTNTVTIQGQGFTTGSTVTFGTTAATSVTFVSVTTLTAVAPAHGGGPVNVTVANANGTAILPSAYQYTGLPIISGVSPSAGPLAGGTSVSVKGYNLKTVSQVTLGGSPATIVSASAGTVVVTAPPFPGGANPVTVVAIDPNGLFTLAGVYDYQLLILTQGLDDGYPTFPYSNTLKVTEGTPPYNWSITSGALPSGLSLNPSTGVISGTPAANYGTYNLTFQVQDSSPTPNVASTSLSFNILFGFTTDTITTDLFGMILYDQTTWPLVEFGALGKGLATTWPFIEQTKGVYNWSVLDRYVEDAAAHDVAGTSTPFTLYWTNANVPPWAASDPTTCSAYTGTSPAIYGCTSTVANIQDFANFMTAVVTRYNGMPGSQGLIQIYELWSEPNVSNVYTGSYADLVTLTSTAYGIIRANNPSATILSPSPTAAPYFQAYATTPGAPLGVDAVAIHGYPQVSQNDAPEAITGFKSVPIKLAMVQIPGLGIKPIWDTESSWGGELAITDPSEQAGYVARSYLLHWSAGIHHLYWYGWDSPVWGTLYYPEPGIGMTPAAYAYQYTYNWLVGAAMPAPCTANGGSTYAAVYTCQLTRPGGYTALAVWDSSQTCNAGTCTTSSFTPPAQYIQYRDLQGNLLPITAGQTLQIGARPILLENMTAPNYQPPVPNATFSYSGFTPTLSSSAAQYPYTPAVPSSSNEAPTGSPAAGQIAPNHLIVMPGLSAPIGGTQAVDSDANIAVGTTQVMQWADFGLQVYNKSGNPIGPGIQGVALWTNNSPCSGGVGADGTVQFDKAASIWLVGMRSGSNTECIGVSQTSDATQKYVEYTLQYVDALNPGYQMDYPKLGVWPDGYYLVFDMLDTSIIGYPPRYSVACALERSAMLLGAPNPQAICFTTQYNNTSGFFHLMPSDLDSPTPPPAGSPNHIFAFAKPVGASQYHLFRYEFHVDFGNPTASTFTGPFQVDTNAFANVVPACGAGNSNCVPQPPPALWPLDSVGGYLMGRGAYRNFGTYESLLLSQAVQTAAGDPVGVRWYELRGLESGASIYQDGFLQAANNSTTPDGFSRWMSSMAQDSAGNIAIGYSISGAAATSYYSGFPGLAIDARAQSTPLGTLQTEEIVFPGVSVEEPDPNSTTPKLGRWGSVSGMALDPVDQCTFWFTGQYEPAPGVYNWSTQIVSFSLPGCL
jgi:hypothetical protein